MKSRSVVLVVLCCGFIGLLVFRAVDYAKKTAPSERNSGQSQRVDARASTNQAAAPATSPSSDAKANPEATSAKEGSLTPADWRVFSVDEYGFEIAYPPNWPTKMDGNILTIGDTEGDGKTKCYLTIEFQGTKGSREIIPAAVTHIAYEQMEQGEQCNATLSKITKSGKFSKLK